MIRVNEESKKAGLKLDIQKTRIIVSGHDHHFMAIDGKKKMEKVMDFIFLGSKITANSDCSHGIKRQLFLGRKTMTNLNSILKRKHIILMTKVCIVIAMVFPVVTYVCESWSIKTDECQRIDAFHLWSWRKLFESPSDCKEIKPVNPTEILGNQPWIFIGRTDVEAPILWPPDAKSQLTGKDPDAGEDWRQEEKGTTEDEMVG